MGYILCMQVHFIASVAIPPDVCPGWGGPQVNKSERVTGDWHQMSLAGRDWDWGVMAH